MAKGNRDLELLIKMMGQFGNENDNVVVGAARQATKQLAKLGVGTWEEFCRGHFTIAADPFEGISFPQFGNGGAPPPVDNSFRRGVSPIPQPTHNPSQTTVPPRPSPQSAASPNSPPPQTRKENMFRATCHLCSNSLPTGSGWLDGKGKISGQWMVKCKDTWECTRRSAKLAKSKKARAATVASVDSIMNLIDQ